MSSLSGNHNGLCRRYAAEHFMVWQLAGLNELLHLMDHISKGYRDISGYCFKFNEGILMYISQLP